MANVDLIKELSPTLFALLHPVETGPSWHHHREGNRHQYPSVSSMTFEWLFIETVVKNAIVVLLISGG
jgi:hypothetical protein